MSTSDRLTRKKTVETGRRVSTTVHRPLTVPETGTEGLSRFVSSSMKVSLLLLKVNDQGGDTVREMNFISSTIN